MRSWLLMLVLACGSEEHLEVRDVPGEDDGSETVTEPAEVTEPEPAEVTEPETAEATEPAPEAATVPEVESPPRPSAPTGEPSVFTRVMFDLRGMPHRGPRDVDPEMIRMRTELLMHRMREAAGAPEPRLTYHPGVSTFRAEFYGSRTDALAQCRRALRQVAPPVDRSKLSSRAALSEPRATPCAPID